MTTLIGGKVIREAPVRGAEPGLPVPFGGTLMGWFGVAHHL